MSVFSVGQDVLLASNPDLVFQIIRINADQSFDIQGRGPAVEHLKYHHIPAEMLRGKEH